MASTKNGKGQAVGEVRLLQIRDFPEELLLFFKEEAAARRPATTRNELIIFTLEEHVRERRTAQTVPGLAV